LQIQLNVDKCVVLRCTRSLSPTHFVYKVNDETLQVKDQHRYLGSILHESMQWSYNIQAICVKANISLNFLCHFLRRNLSKCSTNVKENAYLTITRSSLEYAARIWDPYNEYLIYEIEKIQ